MGWSYKVHGGTAAILGTVSVALTALTWLPVTVPWPGLHALLWTDLVLLLVVAAPALGRLQMRLADAREAWTGFRCLPLGLRTALGALLLVSLAQVGLVLAADGDLHAPRAEAGRYFALDARTPVEISRARYLEVVDGRRRLALGAAGLMLLTGACAALTAGEVRRADRAAALSRTGRPGR
ncbi:hypothetical protein [Streptomyces fragilis]|uniref:Integral membrane protein n=1 Tax=Streptomyces fragilis TaxID=67301 RepID=A0ABV2YAM9_9ACTN|nr:hypothetical protein [Streptomyces fragilis]